MHCRKIIWASPRNYSYMSVKTPILDFPREGNCTPLQYSCLENPMDGGAWWAAAHGVAKSWTRPRDFTFTFHFHAFEKKKATHSSVLAWRIPGTGEPGALPSMGSHRVGHDWSDLVVVVDKWFIQTAWKEQTKTEGFYRCPRGEKSLALKWTEFPSDKTDTLFLSSNISTGFLNM